MTFRDLFSTKCVYRHRAKNIHSALTLLMAGCLLLNSVPDAFGFWTFWNVDRDDGKAVPRILTEHVHKDFWMIKYRYADDCSERLIKEDLFPEVLTIEIQTWLQALREYTDRRIVNDFRFEQYAEPKLLINARGQFQAGPDRDDADLYCIIHGPKFGKVGSVYGYASISGRVPVIGIPVGHSGAFNRRHKATILHELGHAFGLADTYIRPPHFVSTGGLRRTVGKQPASIMASLSLSKSPKFYGLSRDDLGGILYVYKRIHEGMPRTACETIFPDYHHIEVRADLAWCEPKHPLHDALKYLPPLFAAWMLEQDEHLEVSGPDEEGMTPLHLAMLKGYTEIVTELLSREDLDVNVRDPKTGNTALHLAVLDNDTDFVKKLLAHPKIKVNIHNKQTRTPAQLARHLKRFHLTKLIWEHPTVKLLPWAVVPTGKLTTTWGHLKKQY